MLIDGKNMLFQLDKNRKEIVSLTAEIGIIQDDNKYVSISEIGEQAGLDSKQMQDFTKVSGYVNLNEKSQLVLMYFTELVALSESEGFVKIETLKPDSELTLKISAKTKKKTIDFYFIFDAEDIHLSENN